MLLNYVASVAYDAVRHRVEHAFDPWWRLSHHVLQLASEFHIITLHDLHDLKPIAEDNADSFLPRGCLNAAETQPDVEPISHPAR